MSWAGRTIAEAKAEQAATLARLFEGHGSPLMLRLPGGDGVCLIYQNHDGYWDYTFCRFDDSGPVMRIGGTVSGRWSEREAEIKARRHLAQIGYKSPEKDGASYLHRDDHEGKRDHARWCVFQVEYAKARAEGLTDIQAHTRACEGSAA